MNPTAGELAATHRPTIADLLAGDTDVLVRYELSAAHPEHGLRGGLRTVVVEDRHVRTTELTDHTRQLSDWARAILMRERSPLGLYVAECGVPDPDDPDALCSHWLSEESLAWSDNDEWRTGLRLNPGLPG